MDYSTYLGKISNRLSEQKFEVKRELLIADLKIDLFGFVEQRGFSLVTFGAKYITCFFVFKEQLEIEFVQDYVQRSAEFGIAYRRPNTGFAACLPFPVTVSTNVRNDIISYVQGYDPGFARKQTAKFEHPVVVDLSSGEVYHRTRDLMGAMGYMGTLNKTVQLFSP